MMTILFLLHGFVCAVLVILVLIQRGRGGGLVESFAGVESMFGTKTNAFLTRATSILAVLFFLSCLNLAIFSIRQSRSLMSNVKTQAPAATAPATAVPENPTATTPASTPATQPTQDAPKAP